jgi:hypothetical protein
MADGWRADRVWLDVDEVTMRCRGILFREERPVAVELFRLDARGEFCIEHGQIQSDVREGDVRVEGLRLRSAT